MKLTFNNKPNERVVLPDGREVWLSRSVAVVGVILAMQDDNVYVAIEQRGKNLDYPGRWCVPCGYIDYNESGEEAMRREIYEELGIDVKDFTNIFAAQQPWHVNTDPLENRQNITLRYGFIFDFTNKDLPKFEIDNKEVVDAKWVRVDSLNQDFAFNHDKLIKLFCKCVS